MLLAMPSPVGRRSVSRLIAALVLALIVLAVAFAVLALQIIVTLLEFKIVTLGGFLFYNTNVLNTYATASERMERRAEYERRYGRYEGIPQPRLTGTELHVEIHPGQRAASIRGSYRLVNRDAAPMRGRPPDAAHRLRLDRRHRPVRGRRHRARARLQGPCGSACKPLASSPAYTAGDAGDRTFCAGEVGGTVRP